MLFVPSNNMGGTPYNSTFYYLVVIRISGNILKAVGNFDDLVKIEEFSYYFRGS